MSVFRIALIVAQVRLIAVRKISETCKNPVLPQDIEKIPNYQHPIRNQEFGPYLDRFSFIVIYLALKALTLTPNLWEKYSTGENLLFRQKDFLAPDKSKLLATLESVPALRPLIPRFRSICKTDLIQVPHLADFISGRMATVLPESRVAARRWEQYEIVLAEQRQRLLEIVGQRVTIVGKITKYAPKVAKNKKPHVFLDFGDWTLGAFRLIIWSEAMQLFQSKGRDLQSCEGKWVSITGLLTEYQERNGRRRPQVVVDTPSEIEVLRSKEEAEHRLRGGTGSWPPTSSIAPSRPRKHTKSHFDLGVAYAQQGRWDDATREYHAALTDLDAADKHYTTGLICWLQGKADRAVQEYKIALKIKSNDAELHFNLGLLLCTQRGFSNEVIHEWRVAAQLGSESARNLLSMTSDVHQPRKLPQGQSVLAQEHFGRGLEYDSQRRLGKAIQEYKTALRINPNYAEAHVGLGWAYKQQGRLDEAIIEYETALRINPDYALARHNLGWAYGEKGRLDKTIRAFQSALHTNSNDAQAHFGLGWAYGEQGRLDKAIYEYQTALRINPNLDGAHLNLGWAYSRQGRQGEAIREYQAAIRINPSNHLAHFYLGVTYKQQGRVDEARRKLETAAQLGYKPAQDMLREMGHQKASPEMDDVIPF